MKDRLPLILVVLLVACDMPSSPGRPDESATPLSETALLAHLDFLAADSLFGRQAGSEHELRAAEYIRGEFMKLDLEPGAGDYFQTFRIQRPGPAAGVQSQNVLGVLPGSGILAGQWVIVGAHYDHLGWQQVNADSVLVFNGADDNASGTALLLELARHISREANDGSLSGDRRSILFQAFGAEEIGLLGSKHFCAQPTIVTDSVVAMLNMDMVGRLRSDRITLTGAFSSAAWDELLTQANDAGLSFVSDGSLLSRSDQACFYDLRTPVLLLSTGFHAQYHQPTDDVRLINRAGMLKVGGLAVDLLSQLVTREDRLPFQASGASRPAASTRH